MKKFDFVEVVSKATGSTKTDTKKFYDAMTVVITDSIKRGEEVILQDLFTIKPVRRSARVGRNPMTGALVNIPAKLTISVKLSPKIKKALN